MQFTDPDENTQVRLAELEALDERRLMAQQRLEIYQAQMLVRSIGELTFAHLALVIWS